ncbi:MAG: PrsW family glutamic-type intramembrane protease [Candidatus Peregrinibacteria bacterium]
MNFQLNHIIVVLIAIIPAFLWLYLFLRKHHQNKWLVLLTFIGGMIAAKLIVTYQGYWDTTVNLVFFKVSLVDFRSNIQTLIVNTVLQTFVIFLGVGVMEEFVKFWIMRFISHRFFQSIDDVIELAIVTALGFAFFENVLYFINQWNSLSTSGFILFALFRVTIVTMVHVLCSGVLGYYYGMAFFASPMLKIQIMKQGRSHPILDFLKRVLHLKKSHMYHDQMMVTGLIASMFLHAMYDFVLSLNFTVLGIPLYLPVMLLYFFGGYWYLSYLFEQKDFNLKLGLVGTHVMPKEDFVKLLGEVQEIKEKMKAESPEPVV